MTITHVWLLWYLDDAMGDDLLGVYASEEAALADRDLDDSTGFNHTEDDYRVQRFPVITADQPDPTDVWVIRRGDGREWSNDYGWVDRGDGQWFDNADHREMRLPEGGHWERHQ